MLLISKKGSFSNVVGVGVDVISIGGGCWAKLSFWEEIVVVVGNRNLYAIRLA